MRTHGTYSGYVGGCREECCRQPMRAPTRGSRGDRPRWKFTLAELERLIGTGSLAEIAERLDVSTRTVTRLRVYGLSERLADRYACAVDLHPAIVWPEWATLIEP